MRLPTKIPDINFRPLVIILLALNFARGFAEEQWVLAARRFDIDRDSSRSALSAASVIPRLILEYISVGSAREIGREEKMRRKDDELLSERIDLFLQLGKEMKARDALVLKNLTVLEYEKAMRDQQKKIDDVQKKIDANLKTQRQFSNPEGTGRREFRRIQRTMETESERIALYQDDSEKLFAASEDAEKAGLASRAYQKEIAAAKINALISGSIAGYGNYVSVTVDLIGYPGAKKAASVMEVGSLDDISGIAERLSFRLQPQIRNGLPVELEFHLFPQESAQSAVLTIDNIVYNKIPDRVLVSSGFHSVSVEAEGFVRETFVYDFSGKQKFLVDVSFREKSDGSVRLALSRFTNGNLFFDGKFAGSASPHGFVEVPLKVNGDTVFGYFEGELADKDADGGVSTETMFMQIPSKLMTDGNELEANVKVFDVSRNIDKRRRMLYISYSALILSLPYLFVTYGKFTSLQRAYASGHGDVSIDDYNRYRTLSLVGTGITAACGVWFVAELVAYLVAVDKTLPPKARKIRAKTRARMEEARLLEESRLEEERNAPEAASENEGVVAEPSDSLDGLKENE